MTQKLILAIDQGTTSTRALIYNAKGEVIAKSQKELKIFTPHSGWVEQDANDIWADVVETCRDVLAQVNIDDVIGIGITNQRETTIVWDKNTGEPIYNAIVWQDRRTADFCETLKPYEDDIQSRTGLLADPYFSATKIKWILHHYCHPSESWDLSQPPQEIPAFAGMTDLLFGTVDSYLLWKLTDGQIHATDASNAARTMLYNIHDNQWDETQCDRIGVPMNMLPTVMDNCADFGVTKIFDKPLPILAMVGDQQAATFGQACFEKGQVKSTYGTGCFALMNTGDTPVTSKNRLLSTIAWRIHGQTTYALEGSIFVAGAAIQFLRDNLNLFDNAKDTEGMAMSVPDSDGVVFVPALTGLGAPYWNPNVRGAILGLSRGTTSAHITRAALEAQALQTRDLMDAMTADSGVEIQNIRVDGGLVANDFVCQEIANQTGASIDRPINQEATVWGAAAMAFLQAGVFTSLNDITDIYALDKHYKPDGNRNKNNALYTQWQKAIGCVQGF